MSASEEESRGPVIRDRRRIDPVTGQVREAAQSRGSGQARPGKHAVSKPGGLRQEAAGAAQPADQAAPGSGAAGPGGARAPGSAQGQTGGRGTETARPKANRAAGTDTSP